MILAEVGRKLGVITRLALQQLRRSRTGMALIRGVQATAASLGGVLHQLWLEVTGFIFLVLAAVGATSGFREYAKLHAGRVASPSRLVIAIVFSLCFAWFGLSSFWRVNKNVARRRDSRLRSEIR
jgi:hypothetical protein